MLSEIEIRQIILGILVEDETNFSLENLKNNQKKSFEILEFLKKNNLLILEKINNE
jgi:hypothetical protein